MSVKKCIGCGFCCRKGPCGELFKYLSWEDDSLWRDNSKVLYTKPKRKTIKVDWEKDGCPELRWNGDKWRCGLFVSAVRGRVKRAISDNLFFGEGCCCGLNTYRLTNHVPTPGELENEDKILSELCKFPTCGNSKRDQKVH